MFSNDLCKLIEIYIYARKKRPFTSYPAAKHPKHSEFAVTDMQQIPLEFLLLYSTCVDFNSRNSFANLGSFAKGSVPVQSIIPWLYAVWD